MPGWTKKLVAAVPVTMWTGQTPSGIMSNVSRIDLPYLWLPAFRGKPAAYYRRGTLVRRIRGPDRKPLLPGDAGFLDAYQAIHREYGSNVEKPAVAPRSLAALIAEYKASDRWRDLAEATQQDYSRVFATLEKYSRKSVPDMARQHVMAIRNEFSVAPDGKPTPRRANKVVAIISLLLAFSIDLGWRKDNPALRPKRLKTGPGYATWTEAEFRRFIDHSHVSEPLKRAAALAYYTGMRVSDCVGLPKTARRDGWIEIVPAKTAKKTKARVEIPEHPELTAILDATPASDAVTLLCRLDGQPWKLDHIKHAMSDAVRLVGLRPGLSFHGLRKGLHASLAESGATDAEMAAVVPHSDPKQIAHYRKQAAQKKLAASAIAKLPVNSTKTPSDRQDDGD